ncbi:MAG: hypothetical protein ACLR9T_06740 [Thomasclavelia sp.]|uniref:hypothetical protein n=1 Tax=Thomasclavelia sp. TaxID=3025757 RepID=UPI0039A11142
MKKKLIFIILAILVLLPIKRVCKDGGTITYTSISYKIIIWKTLESSESDDMNNVVSNKEKIDFYIFPFNFGTLDSYR